ncbi:MAG: ROK family protein [Pseudorhodobacter sp.]|nr:ROK family protein [Pseudorhodobacter sp.]
MILCFDIGGSRIKAALAEGDRLTALGDCPTPGGDFGAFLAALTGFAAGLSLRGVAISIAGVVAPDTGRIKVANIPCADGRVLADEISAALHLPVVVLNDADCFALAEARQGAGRGHRNVFGVILGTGVGGGLVIDGRLVQGAGGYAGEWGHGPVVAAPWNLLCGCGLRGCVDAVCGARGLEKLHNGLHGEALPSTAILSGWQAGEARAGKTVDLWLDLITPPLALVMNVVGASVVPVGGGLSNVPALLAALDTRLRAAILWRAETPLVVPALCRPEPGLIGAAEAGREAFAQ